MTPTIPFTKVQALGNDFVVLDAAADPSLDARDDLPALARFACDRHAGIGADGVIVMARADSPAAARMRIYNADGSDGGVCGNGARCVVRLMLERGHCRAAPDGSIALRCGTRDLRAGAERDARGTVSRVTIDMGAPELDAARVPVNSGRLAPTPRPHEYRLDGVDAVFVSMGNPHMVVFVPGDFDVDREIHSLGPKFETHPAFPARMNVHLVRAASRDHADLRTWERGAGHTRGCGSGSCAVLVAGVLTDRLGRRATIAQPGGEVVIDWQNDRAGVLMSGGAELVYSGTFEWPRR